MYFHGGVDMKYQRVMTATEAAEVLGISLATLYSYVSRGLIHSEATPDDSRERRYLAEDIHRLAERKAQRRDPSKAARDALRWGPPVLESGLTLITENALYYRGYDVAELVQQDTFEEVAALLWTENRENATSLFQQEIPSLSAEIWKTIHALPMFQAMNLALIFASEADLNAFDLRSEKVAATGARILKLLAWAVTPSTRAGNHLAETLAHGWQVQHTRLLNAALIVCADHELNASAFASRVVASAEANPYAVVMGGLAALSGFKHGGHTRRVAAFLREIETTGDIRSVIREHLQRGQSLAGFGHHLYPDGDPRAKILLSMLRKTFPDRADLALVNSIAAEVEQITGEKPTVDFALVALQKTLGLPKDAPLGLFALGRAAGWVGHAIEQYATGELIRPRAAYRGKPPR
jgi:citrate synthase